MIVAGNWHEDWHETLACARGVTAGDIESWVGTVAAAESENDIEELVRA